MGRRRTTGASRSAGSGRVCPHPQSRLEYQAIDEKSCRVRCRRCGAELLPELNLPSGRTKPWRPAP